MFGGCHQTCKDIEINKNEVNILSWHKVSMFVCFFRSLVESFRIRIVVWIYLPLWYSFLMEGIWSQELSRYDHRRLHRRCHLKIHFVLMTKFPVLQDIQGEVVNPLLGRNSFSERSSWGRTPLPDGNSSKIVWTTWWENKMFIEKWGVSGDPSLL